jgi:uncharacterized OB-fold protein
MNRDARAGRSVPKPVGLNAQFYEHAAREGLHLQRCTACDTWRHPPRFVCASCGSTEWHWERASDRGRVFSWTITHRAVDPALAGAVPYAVVVVELDEGVRLVGNIAGEEDGVLSIDRPVVVDLDRRSDAVALIDFRPA